MLCIPPLTRERDVGPIDAAGGGALLPRAPRAADRRSAGGLDDARASALEGTAPVAVSQRQRRHVLSAGAGLRPAARPVRGVRLRRGRRRHDRALGRDLAGLGRRRERGGDPAPGPAPGRRWWTRRTRAAGAGRHQHAACRCAAARAPASSPRTLAGGGGRSDWRYLSARRLALFVAASIEQGTRWVLLEHNGPAASGSARSAQVEAFLDGWPRQGAFVGAAADETHFVIAMSASTARQPSPRASSTCCSASRPASRAPLTPGWSRTAPARAACARCPSTARRPRRTGSSGRSRPRSCATSAAHPCGAPKPPPPGVSIGEFVPGRHAEGGGRGELLDARRSRGGCCPAREWRRAPPASPNGRDAAVIGEHRAGEGCAELEPPHGAVAAAPAAGPAGAARGSRTRAAAPGTPPPGSRDR